MILQRDQWIEVNYPEIRDNGCYLFSIVWFAVMYEHISVSAQSICEELYPRAVKRGYVGNEAYPLWMINSEGVFGLLGMDVEYRGHFPSDYQCKAGEFEILKYHHRMNDWDHFVAGNGQGIVTYDPWGAVAPYNYSITVSEGVLESKRIFKG
jgi:hypothetical protein